MALHPGNAQGYNNEIIIAGSEAVIGHNSGINESEPPQGPSVSTFKGKIAPPAGSVQRGPQGPTPHAEKVTPVASQYAAELRAKALQQVKARAHEEEKVAIVTGGIALANPELPREAGSPQQWSWPTNSPQAKLQFFLRYLRAKRQYSQLCQAAALAAKLARARPRAWR